MNSELIVEEGIVISVENEFANVAVIQSESCNDCSAKIFCKPKSSNENIIKVDNSFGAKAGDEVRFQVEGIKLLNASFLLYGIPLIILLIGIFLGLSVFSNYANKELYAFLFGLGLCAIYFLLSFGKYHNTNKVILPKIISIKLKQ
jgi:sigma-E factor negative regulatory protein RseC